MYFDHDSLENKGSLSQALEAKIESLIEADSPELSTVISDLLRMERNNHCVLLYLELNSLYKYFYTNLFIDGKIE